MEVLPELGVNASKTKIVELDLKDKKILYELSKNYRIPISQLARKVGLSRDSVSYRLSNLKKNRVIVGSRTVVDITKFGYNSYHIFLSLKNPSEDVEKEFVEKLKKFDFIRAVLKCYGSYDFEIGVIAKNTIEFDNIVMNIFSEMKNYINSYEILILTKPIVGKILPREFISVNESEENRKKNGKGKKIDKKDLEIIKELRDNAGLSLIELSKKTRLSADAVQYRLRNLDNFIVGFTPAINYHSLGYSIQILFLNFVGIDNEKEKKIMDFFRTQGNIIWAVKTIGGYNFLTYLAVRDNDELQQTINNIRKKFPNEIDMYETVLGAVEYQYTYVPDCLFKD